MTGESKLKEIHEYKRCIRDLVLIGSGGEGVRIQGDTQIFDLPFHHNYFHFGCQNAL